MAPVVSEYYASLIAFHLFIIVFFWLKNTRKHDNDD